MTTVIVDYKPKRGDPLYGYATKYPPSETTVSIGRELVTVYAYTVPDEVADEMIANGATKDEE